MRIHGGIKVSLFIISIGIISCLSLWIRCGGSTVNDSGSECVDNVADNPALSAYVCSSGIAATPGTLTLLPVGSAGAPQSRGYAEYVPADYSDKCNWPVIIYLHGDGELGDGKTEAVLEPFKNFGLTGQICLDNWDSQHRFIVLAPQFVSYDDRSGVNVDTFIQFAKANYKIDPTRIYLTAVSGGGVALGNYMSKYAGGEAAAMLPVSCYVPPTNKAYVWKSIPIWMLCGASDTTVGPANLVAIYNNLMSAVPPPAVTPKLTLYTGVGHEGKSATDTYAPALINNTCETSYSGVTLSPYSNIYDWMLKYHR